MMSFLNTKGTTLFLLWTQAKVVKVGDCIGRKLTNKQTDEQ